MQYSDVFGSCHPAVNFLYFVLVIAFSMCLTHPVCLLLSVCGAVIYHAVLLGPRSLRKSAVWMVPMAVLAAVINPAFTHQGVTILAYLPSGNPLTLESMLYGLASAALLSATLLWFSCYNTVMTSDKFIYLFGRVIPALSLVLSMTMRFVPRFRTQLHTVAQAQKYMGRDTGERQPSPPHEKRHEGLFHHGHMVAGERHRDGGQYEEPGLRRKGPHGLFHLSHGRPGSGAAGMAYFLRGLCILRCAGRRPAVPLLSLVGGSACDAHDREFFRGLFSAVPDPGGTGSGAARQWRQIEKEARR